MNAKNQTRLKQNNTPKSFTFSGIVSAITTADKSIIPNIATKITNEKLAMGIMTTFVIKTISEPNVPRTLVRKF